MKASIIRRGSRQGLVRFSRPIDVIITNTSHVTLFAYDDGTEMDVLDVWRIYKHMGMKAEELERIKIQLANISSSNINIFK